MSEEDREGNSDAEIRHEELRKEARHTLSEQIDRIEMTDEKAIGLFRTDIVLVGLLITSVSVVARATGLEVLQFVNLHTGFGIAALLGAIATAAMAYTSSTYDMGISDEFIEDIEPELEGQEAFRDKIEAYYGSWLKSNRQVISFNSGVVTLSIILITDALILFTSGAAVGAYGLSITWLSAGMLLGLLVLIAGLDYAIYKAERVVLWIFSN